MHLSIGEAPTGAEGGATTATRPRDAQGRTAAPAFQSVQQPEYNRGQSLPYQDRPYGAPDTW